jgi:hypothetical protein
MTKLSCCLLRNVTVRNNMATRVPASHISQRDSQRNRCRLANSAYVRRAQGHIRDAERRSRTIRPCSRVNFPDLMWFLLTEIDVCVVFVRPGQNATPDDQACWNLPRRPLYPFLAIRGRGVRSSQAPCGGCATPQCARPRRGIPPSQPTTPMLPVLARLRSSRPRRCVPSAPACAPAGRADAPGPGPPALQPADASGPRPPASMPAASMRPVRARPRSSRPRRCVPSSPARAPAGRCFRSSPAGH